MALKHLLDLNKTDRYTADGRDKINELQAKVTEDVSYKPGDISQKTGLQKQPDGSWAPPKKGGKPAAKKEAGGKTDKVGEFMKAYERGDFGKYQQNAEQKKAENFFKENKSAAQEEIGKFYTKFEDAQSAYDAGRSTFPEGGYKIYKTPQGYKVVDDPKTQQRMEAAGYEIEADVPEGTKPPKSQAVKNHVTAGKLESELTGNFWTRSEDFEDDISSNGWDVEEMTNEYAVISNPNGSQYEVRFNDHGDGDTFTVRSMKALMVDEDDEDDLEDAAPKIRELTGDCKIKIRQTQDVKYKTGDISQKTGLQKQPDGSWKPPRNGSKAAAGSGGNTPAGVPSFHGMESGDYDNKLRAEGWETGGWEGNAMHSSAIFKKGDRTIRVVEGQPGKISHVEEIKPKTYTNKEGRRNFRAALEDNPKDAYDFSKTVEHSIPMSAGDKEQLANIKSFMQDENTDYKDAIKSIATGLVNGNQMRGDWYPEKEQSVLKIAKSVGLEKELMNYIKANHKGYEFGYSEDAAPKIRKLTGDCKIRVRKA